MASTPKFSRSWNSRVWVKIRSLLMISSSSFNKSFWRQKHVHGTRSPSAEPAYNCRPRITHFIIFHFRTISAPWTCFLLKKSREIHVKSKHHRQRASGDDRNLDKFRNKAFERNFRRTDNLVPQRQESRGTFWPPCSNSKRVIRHISKLRGI